MPRKKTVSDEEVLAATAKVMFAKGPDFTLSDVSVETGIAPATLMQRFSDKRGLVIAAITHDNALLAISLANLPAGTGSPAVISVFRLLMPGEPDVTHFADQLLWLRQDMRDPDLNRLARERFAMLRDAVVARLPAMRVPPTQAAMQIEALWNGALIQWGLERKGSLIDFVERTLTAWFALAVGPPASGSHARQDFPDVLAPFVPTPHEVVDHMLRLAAVNAADLVYDLGCGDGRIVVAAARDFAAHAVGFDTEPGQMEMTLKNIAEAGVVDRVVFRQQDLQTVDLSPASVITLYLSHFGNHRLQDTILAQCRPGTRVVSHAFPLANWRPNKTESVTDAEGRERTIHLWVVPQPGTAAA